MVYFNGGYKRLLLFCTIAFLFLGNVVDVRLRYEVYKNEPHIVDLKLQICLHPVVIGMQGQLARLQENEMYRGMANRMSYSYDVVLPYIDDASRKLSYYRRLAAVHVYEPLESTVFGPLDEYLKTLYWKYAASYMDSISEFYYIYLASYVESSTALLHRVHDRVVPVALHYTGVVLRSVWSQIQKQVIPAILGAQHALSHALYRQYLHLRIAYYVFLLPSVKQNIYVFQNEVFPQWCHNIQQYYRTVLLAAVSDGFRSITGWTLDTCSGLYRTCVYPYIQALLFQIEQPIAFCKNQLYPRLASLVRVLVVPVAVLSAKAAHMLHQNYIGPGLDCLRAQLRQMYVLHLEPFLLNEKHENCIAVFFSSQNNILVFLRDKYHSFIVGYNEFLTSDPLDAEIQRLSLLLAKYSTENSEVMPSSITVAHPTPSETATNSVNMAKTQKTPVAASDKGYPLERQIARWREIVEGTCVSVLEDFEREFSEFEQQYVNDKLQPVLQDNLKSLNDFINEGYYVIQSYIRDIDSSDVFLNNENFIINDDALKADAASDMKYFKNEYPNGAVDSNGLGYEDYLQLVDEISYINELAYNKSLIKRSTEDPTFEDRDFFLKYVLVGKDIQISHGNTTNTSKDDIAVNQYTVLSPGAYNITSDLLRRVTLGKATGGLIRKVDRKVVREEFTKRRSGIEQKADIMKQAIENGFYEVVEQFNQIKFRNMEIFEEFSDSILMEWDRQFFKHLEETDHSFLFDLDSVDTSDAGIVEFYEEKKDVYNAELEKQKALNVNINHRKNWKNFKKFYKIKEILLRTREELNAYQPNLDAVHSVAKPVDQTVGILLGEANQYLDILRAKANLAFQFREEAEKAERIRRYYKFNGVPEPSEEDVLRQQREQEREETQRQEYERLQNSLLDGKPDDEGYIQAKLARQKDPEEIISELEAEDVEYYYDDDGYYYDGYENYDLATETVVDYITVSKLAGLSDSLTEGFEAGSFTTEMGSEMTLSASEKSSESSFENPVEKSSESLSENPSDIASTISSSLSTSVNTATAQSSSVPNHTEP